MGGVRLDHLLLSQTHDYHTGTATIVQVWSVPNMKHGLVGKQVPTSTHFVCDI